MQTVYIYTDGACRGNPGPGGWGAVLVYNEHHKEIYGGEQETTNNKMELKAAIEALKHLKRPCRVELTTDSQYLRQGITQWIHQWKKRDWKTAQGKPVKNQPLWQALDAEIQKHDVHWYWVKAHNEHPQNERADALANQGINELDR